MRCGTQARCRSTTRWRHTQSGRLAPCCSPRWSPRLHAPQPSHSCPRCSPHCSQQQSSRSARRSSQARSHCPAASPQTQCPQRPPAVRQALCTQHRCCSPTRWPGTRCAPHQHLRSTPSRPSRPARQQSRSQPRCSPRCCCSRQHRSRSARRSSQLRSSCPAASPQTLQAYGPRRRIQHQPGKQARCRCATRSRPTRCPRLDQQR